jgi:hypothetical protein
MEVDLHELARTQYANTQNTSTQHKQSDRVPKLGNRRRHCSDNSQKRKDKNTTLQDGEQIISEISSRSS